MRRAILLAAAVWMIVIVSGCATSEQMESGQVDIKKLLSEMTVEEKVGQMTQITLEVVSKRGEDNRTIILDEEKLREAIVDYKVGSILNCGGAANTIENWHEVITKIQEVAMEETRAKIPIIYGIDSIHGANYIVDATLFGHNFAMAATWNRELVRKGAQVTAAETRAAGIPWNFNPVFGLGRQPLWPRFFETYGEDAYLASEMARIYVKAQQGDDMSDGTKVAACMKHYFGYSVPLTGKDRTPAWIPVYRKNRNRDHQSEALCFTWRDTTDGRAG